MTKFVEGNKIRLDVTSNELFWTKAALLSLVELDIPNDGKEALKSMINKVNKAVNDIELANLFHFCLGDT